MQANIYKSKKYLLRIYQLKLISFAFKEADSWREGILEVAVVPGLQGVMEGDDGAATGVFHHIGQNLGTLKFLAIVACDDIPHHDLVVVTQHDVLLPAHPAMRGTEQTGVKHFIGKVGIL